MQDIGTLEDAAWSAAYGIANEQQAALLESDPGGWRGALERLLDQTEERLTSAGRLEGPERAQVVADLEGVQAQLRAAFEFLNSAGDGVVVRVAFSPELAGGTTSTDEPTMARVTHPRGQVRQQATWSHGRSVIRAGA